MRSRAVLNRFALLRIEIELRDSGGLGSSRERIIVR
jgi:hypothetical protein